ncbi:MAG: hypothetical protein JNK82_30120 [Myxococcaceae bacterium]|nr:hypothetical protein [Myxococcaceae bacterium]
MPFALAAVVLAAAPCAERACLVAAAQKCTALDGSLPVVDWSGMFAIDAKGRTDVVIRPVEGGDCAVTLDLVVTDFKPKGDITPKKAIDRLNGSAKNHVRCVVRAAQAVRLLTELGTKAAGRATFEGCKPTRCAPVPPLDDGCSAGSCRDGEWAVTCGKKTCTMAGVDPEALPDGAAFTCGEGGEVRTRYR